MKKIILVLFTALVYVSAVQAKGIKFKPNFGGGSERQSVEASTPEIVAWRNPVSKRLVNFDKNKWEYKEEEVHMYGFGSTNGSIAVGFWPPPSEADNIPYFWKKFIQRSLEAEESEVLKEAVVFKVKNSYKKAGVIRTTEGFCTYLIERPDYFWAFIAQDSLCDISSGLSKDILDSIAPGLSKDLHEQ